jgi:hypothetical protein
VAHGRTGPSHTHGARGGACVDTLRTGYPYIQALSQDRERCVHPCTATCRVVPNPTSQPRWAPELPCVHLLRTSPPDKKGFDTATCTVAPDPRGGLQCITCPMTPDPVSLLGGLRRCHVSCGSLWATCLKHKKSLAGQTIQLGSHVSNARMHVFEAPDVRAIMSLQDIRVGYAFNACMTCG